MSNSNNSKEEQSKNHEEYCYYCGEFLEYSSIKDHAKCQNYNNPVYFNDYEMANLIGMYAAGVRLGLIGGDCTGEIAKKLQLWCKKYGFPRGNNHQMQIDEVTFDDNWSKWLSKILKSAPQPNNLPK